MTPLLLGIVGVLMLFVLLGLGVPIAWAMGAIGVVGNIAAIGFFPTSVQVSRICGTAASPSAPWWRPQRSSCR